MPSRTREVEKSKEEFLARVALKGGSNQFRLDLLTAYTLGASLRQVVNRVELGRTGKPIQRYQV